LLIPLGATINMAGAAVTISVLTLAAVHTLGIQVDIGTAIIAQWRKEGKEIIINK